MKDRIPFIACNELLLRLFVCLKTGFSSNEIPFLTARKLDDNCKALEASLLLSGAQVSGVSENIFSLLFKRRSQIFVFLGAGRFPPFRQ